MNFLSRSVGVLVAPDLSTLSNEDLQRIITVARWLVLAVLMLLPFLASAQEPCSEDPRYLLVTVVSGDIYADERR